MRAKAPASLTRNLSISQSNQVMTWWRGLPPGARSALRDDPARPPAGVVARFVEPGASADAPEESTDFYEHLVNHEVYIDDGPTFQICSAHPAARAVLACGHLPADFACPRGDAACPMRALLAIGDGRDVRFALRAAKGGARG
jgi:hypothetical protein